MLLIQGFNFSQLLPIKNGYAFKWTLGKSHIKLIKKFLKIPKGSPEVVIEEVQTIQWCSKQYTKK